MKQLNVIVLPGEWELWFLDDERVFSDHRMDWMDLLEMLPKWGKFSWSWVTVEHVLGDDRRNLFSLRSREMPKTYTAFKNMLTYTELVELEYALEQNRTTP